MITFYVLLFLGFALIVTAVCFSIMGEPTWNTLRLSVGLMAAIGSAVFIIALVGAAMFRGYAYFDPEVCAQMVHIENHWSCVTWEEAG